MKKNVDLQMISWTASTAELQNPVFPFNRISLSKSMTADTVNPQQHAMEMKELLPIPANRNYRGEITMQPLFNSLLKYVGASLSKIELALHCNDQIPLRSSARELSSLFIKMDLPMACRCAENMGEAIKENNWEEVKDLLQSVKKIIRQVLKEKDQLN